MISRELKRKVWKARGLSSMQIFILENKALLRRRIIEAQLWRYPENRVKDEDLPPPAPEIPPEILAVARVKKDKPKRGEAVTLTTSSGEKHGTIMNVQWSHGQPLLITVHYNDGSWDTYDYEVFQGNYTTLGGPTRWMISD